MKKRSLTVLLLAFACTRTPPPASPLPLPRLSDARLQQVRAELPELAERVQRIHQLAEAFSARGDRAAAEELATLAEVTLLSASQLLERTPPPPPVPIAAPEPEPSEEEAQPETESEEETPREARRPRRARPEPEPEPVATEDPAVGVRERLATLATRLRTLSASDTEDRVALDGVQTALIEGDRALAEGLVQRATELADEAERRLSSITGEQPPSEAEPRTFEDEARRLLGERAIFRGGVVAVRLDSSLRFDREWRTDDAPLLSHLRSLVRGYRTVRLLLVSVGEGRGEFRESSLAEHLVERFQIPASRLQRVERPGLSLPRGTYLVFRPSEG
ncbi:MAG: hypothetical protein AAGE52_22220 [Myxococcota bacterium]